MMKKIKHFKALFSFKKIYIVSLLILVNLMSKAQSSNLCYGTNSLRLNQNNSGTSGDFNTGIGLNTLYNNTSGSYNIATGMNVLFNNTSGKYNTANGMSTLFTNTSGSYNTAMGMNALLNNTTADSNTAIGVNALFTNTTGYNNIANGVLSLYLNKDGHDNIAIGYQSLYSNISGFNNIAIGSGTLQKNTASNNTAIGYQSLFKNSSGTSNTALGFQSLYSNTTGSDNTAVGYQSLFNTTTAGQYNTAVGSKTLNNNKTGQNNTAIGFESLFSNLNYNNTAVGSSSLRNNTSGKENTAVGASALFQNARGDNNTSMGNSALYFNITGSYNTAMGSNALENNNSNNNTAVGSYALNSCTSGPYNTAMGTGALRFITTGTENAAFGEVALNELTDMGSFNTALGNHALRYHSSGDQNVAVGFESLDSNITGANNTAIGYMAGRENIDGNRNVFIGYMAGLKETGNDKLYIANNSDTPLIYGDFSQRNVGIKTRNAYSNLSITPNIDGSKITLWDGGNQINHNGFGTSANQLNYHVADQIKDHVFYAGGRSGSNGNNKELLRIKGNGKIGIGTNTPQAILDISSTTDGILLPRMTQLQRDMISSKSAGMIIYNTTTEKLNYYDGTAASWKEVGGSGMTSAAGNNGQIQFNNNGVLGAKSNLFWDNTNDQLGIGTANPIASLTVKGNALIGDPGVIIKSKLASGYRLYVQDGILTEKITIASSSSTKWADYVFNNDYKLKPLNELEEYVKINNHLPNIPSAEDVAKNGIDVGNINAKLLEKIEELHLYIFQLEKRIKEIELKTKN